jgi:hypothetical protein
MERCGPSLGNLAWSKLIHTMFPDSEARSRAPKRSGISWWKDPVIIALLKQTTDGERTLNSLELEVNRKLSGDVIVFFVRQETKGVNNLTVVRPRTNTKFPPPDDSLTKFPPHSLGSGLLRLESGHSSSHLAVGRCSGGGHPPSLLVLPASDHAPPPPSPLNPSIVCWNVSPLNNNGQF